MSEYTYSERLGGLSSFALRMVAIVTMLIDHTAAVLPGFSTQEYLFMRSVGRIAFPIFCFLIVEGLTHTRNAGKYMLRLAIFAIVSELPYDLAFHHVTTIEFKQGQNVFLTLLLGLVVIAFAYKAVPFILRSFGAKDKLADSDIMGAVLSLPLLLVGCYAAEMLNTDYGWFGVAAIWVFYVLRKCRGAAIAAVVALNSLKYGFRYNPELFGTDQFMIKTTAVQWFAALAAVPLAFYNGEAGCKKLKWAFYIFYPAHLIILWVIARFAM